MAKGDHDRAESALKDQGGKMQTSQDATSGSLNQANTGFQNTYNQGSAANMDTYGNVMGKYNDLYNNPFGMGEGLANGGLGSGGGGGYTSSTAGIYSDLANNGGGYGWDPMMRGAFGNAISGFGDFAQNGGFSDQGIADIRARAIAPTRAVYQNAQSDLDRSRSLSGGSANYAASKAKMTRDLAYGISDANVNANAGIAEMQQKGRLAGLQGLSSTGAAGQGLSTDIDSLNAQMKLAGLSGLDTVDARNAAAGSAAGARADQSAKDYFNARMGTLGGMQDMYSANPALLNVSGNQLLQSGQNLLANQQNQNDIGRTMIGGTQNLQNIPGDFGQAMNKVKDVVGIGAQIGGAIMGAGGIGGGQQQLPVQQNFPAAQQMGNPISMGQFGQYAPPMQQPIDRRLQ
jgi:hypothetical protein